MSPFRWASPLLAVVLVALPAYLHRTHRRTVTWDVRPYSYRQVDRSALACAPAATGSARSASSSN